ncbi:hypothetical protein EVAR_81232_1 [Eumeta japonica]|uniref:Uncharacterized protein n=1 Tax=Eumeta variegata TaxID=151549 RepID=A0A4C1V2E6_EUMVA|nr:hypothetical protein EVAR_81232_1 [Eumeta japonica]
MFYISVLTGYMLLVLRTIYLQVAGKSQIMTTPTLNSPSHSISESLEENTTVIMQGIVNETSNRERSDAFHSGASDEISESDNVTPRFTETNSISTTSSNISSDDTGRNDRRQTEEHNNLCTNTNNSRFDENVNVLEVTNIQQCTRSDKIADDEKTIPVIYDETQLNICGTPILEENPINRIVLSNIS